MSLSSISLQNEPQMMMVCNNEVSDFKAICRLVDFGLESKVEAYLDTSLSHCFGAGSCVKENTWRNNMFYYEEHTMTLM